MKIVAVYQILNAAEFLEASVDNVIEYVDEVLLMRNEKPWNNPKLFVEDETKSICEHLVDKYPGRVHHYDAPFASIIDQKYIFMDIAMSEHDATHYFLIDFDEGYTPEGYRVLLQAVRDTPDIQSFYVPRIVYWKSMGWKIWPIEPTPALAVINMTLGPVHFMGARHTSGKKIVVHNCRQHHYSYVRKDDDAILRKISHFSHAHEVLKHWYSSIWLGWHPEMIHLHPTHPPCYQKAIPAKLAEQPKEFAALAERYSFTVEDRPQ